MSDDTTSGNKYFWIILTGLVSLAVGVGGGLILHRLTIAQADLVYELKTSEVFGGQKENIAIFALEVRNPGKKEIEDLVCRIELKNPTLREPKVTGLPSSAYSSTQGPSFYQLEAPFLNPREGFSVQLLLSLPSHKLDPPDIRVRGKGTTAQEQKPDGKEEKKRPLATSLAAAISTMLFPLALLLVRRFKPELFYSKVHRDDQRDVLAYMLALNGFDELADVTRLSERRQYYWSTADALAQHCIACADDGLLRRGIKTLVDLIDYASIEPSSQLLIHYNIARLAARIPDDELVKEHLALARKGNHKVIEKRITLDPELSQLASA